MSKGFEHTSLDRGERENKPFAHELVHARIKLEMSCTVYRIDIPMMEEIGAINPIANLMLKLYI